MSAATEHEVAAMRMALEGLNEYLKVCVENSGTSELVGIHMVAACQLSWEKGEVGWELVDHLIQAGMPDEQAVSLGFKLAPAVVALADALVHVTKETS